MLHPAIITHLALGSVFAPLQPVTQGSASQADHSAEIAPKVEDHIVGLWEAVDAPHRVVIEVIRDTNGYTGRIAYMEEANHPEGATDGLAGRPKTDRHNPDHALRDRAIVGITVMSGLQYEDGKWKNGRVYSPDNGKSYRAWAKMEGDQLRVKGYVKIGFLKVGRSVRFRRLEGPLQPTEQIEIRADGGGDGLARLGRANGGL
jgi:uncharacterized protein (DUF2147 family)